MPSIPTLPRFASPALAAMVIACSSCGSDGTTPLQNVPVASVSVSPNPASVAAGATTVLSAAPEDASGNPLSGRAVTWSSSDESKATVSGGVVTGVAVGTAMITATSEGQQGSATVNVTDGGGGGGGGAGNLLAVSFSTYLGGSSFEHVRDVTTDAAGNIYVVGGTQSDDFPVTPGAYQTTHNPGTPDAAGIQGWDAFVMKLSPTGSIIWSTFIGGRNYERAYAVEVDAQGYVYVAGRAGNGFPVTAGAFQTAFQGGQEATHYGPQDGFVCKLNPTGTAMVFCSYFGTSDPNIVRDLDIDAAGDIYLAASVSSGGLPSAWFTNGYKKTYTGGHDAVLAKIKGDGSQVLWATYVGGGADEGHGENSVRLDPSGNVIFLISTGSAGLPTPNGFDASLGGSSDLYVAKFSSTGANLLMASYIGGSGSDFTETHALEVDGQGNIYAAAMTTSTDFPTTTGAYQRTYGGSGGGGTGGGTNYPGDAFVTKISPSGALLASTYLGGRYGDGAEGIGLDAQGNVYVTGAAFSDNFPSTTGPYQGRGGSADAFVSKLSPDLGQLIFSMRIGGSGGDSGRSAHVDAEGNMYIGGEVGSSNWPTMNAVDGSYGGGADSFLVKLIPSN